MELGVGGVAEELRRGKLGRGDNRVISAPALPVIEKDDGAKSGDERTPPVSPTPLSPPVSGSVESAPAALLAFSFFPHFLNPFTTSQTMLSGMI